MLAYFNVEEISCFILPRVTALYYRALQLSTLDVKQIDQQRQQDGNHDAEQTTSIR